MRIRNITSVGFLYVLLLIAPCMIMMGAMVWMTMGGMGGGTRGGEQN